MDVFPTLAEAAGITLPSDLDGRSLMPLLDNRSVPDWRTSLVVAHHGNMYGFCTLRAVVGERYKYVYYPYDTAELYDRQRDPHEMNNLIDDPSHASTVTRLRRRLLDWMEAHWDSAMNGLMATKTYIVVLKNRTPEQQKADVEDVHGHGNLDEGSGIKERVRWGPSCPAAGTREEPNGPRSDSRDSPFGAGTRRTPRLTEDR